MLAKEALGPRTTHTDRFFSTWDKKPENYKTRGKIIVRSDWKR